MIFYRFFVFFVVVLGSYIIYRVAVNSWRKSGVEDKLDEIELEKEIHDQIDEVDIDEAHENKKEINDFLES